MRQFRVKWRKVGIGIDAIGGGQGAPLVGDAEQTIQFVVPRLADIGHARMKTFEHGVDAAKGAFDRAEGIGDELAGIFQRVETGLHQCLAEGVGFAHLLQQRKRLEFVRPHPEHGVAMHGELAVGHGEHIDAQQTVAARRVFDRVVGTDPRDARNFRRVERRRAFQRLRRYR